MHELRHSLETLEAMACERVADAVTAGRLGGVSEAEVIEVLGSVARVERLLDPVMIEAVGEVGERSEQADRDERMTSRLGCHDVSELIQRATRIAPVSASRLQRAAKAVHRERSITTGEPLEALFPAMREALTDGVVGVDGILAVSGPLLATGSRPAREDVLTAESLLAAAARGEGPDAAPPACADLLRVQAQAWSIALDQDGAEPRERRAIHKRSFVLGAPTEYGVPCRGMLMPEVGAQLLSIIASNNNPAGASVRFTDVYGESPDDAVVPVDLRTRAQKAHDALANALSVAASSELLPTIGGAAPTLVVSVREQDLESGSGFAHVEGCEVPVAIATAEHVACAGYIQRITLGAGGRIVKLGTEERVFNRRQRRAIALRDGGYIIPGCGVPAGWCEIHHVKNTPRAARHTPTTGCCCAGITIGSSSAAAGRSG